MDVSMAASSFSARDAKIPLRAVAADANKAPHPYEYTAVVNRHRIFIKPMTSGGRARSQTFVE
jgi:hypothetical protein